MTGHARVRRARPQRGRVRLRRRRGDRALARAARPRPRAARPAARGSARDRGRLALLGGRLGPLRRSAAEHRRGGRAAALRRRRAARRRGGRHDGAAHGAAEAVAAGPGRRAPRRAARVHAGVSRPGAREATAELPFAVERYRPTHGGSTREPARRRVPSCLRARRRKTFRLPHQRYSTLKERALHPLQRAHPRRARTRCATSSFDVGERRVLRHRRAQRQRQEHAAQVPRRASTRSTRARSTSTGRLSPFIELGVGFNPELTARDNVLINAIMLGLSRREARGALRRDHRVRRARGVRGPEAQELLVGHERAARRSPWRSRSTPTSCSSTRCSPSATPPSSASASTSSTRMKRGGQDDPVRHARHGGGRALLRPRDAARARRGSSPSARPSAIAQPTASSTSATRPATSPGSGPARTCASAGSGARHEPGDRS